MRLCMVSGSWPPAVCGVADAMRIYSGLFTENGANSFNIITTKSYNKYKNENPNLNVYDIVKKWGFRDLYNILKTIRLACPDIIHIQYPTKEYKKHILINFLPIILRMLGKKIVITIHEYSFNLTFKGRIRLWPSILGAHCVLVSDPAYIVDIRKIFKNKRIEVLPIASNIPASNLNQIQKAEFKKVLIGNTDNVLIGFFGFVNRNKIILPLFDIIKVLNQKLGITAKLLIIGATDRDKDGFDLKKEIEKSGIQERCIITGYVDDVKAADYLSIVDFGVLLYESGVSPRNATFLAARSQNIKIITTYNPGYSPDSESIFVVNNDEMLVENICRIIIENKNKKLSAAGEDFYKSGWSNFLKKHIDVYASLCERS